ncbi:alpha/beta fold hydrolase [Paenarthrobacter nicotinovorans]|uniref:alpha/beta fold hydrolase n=1 Tax=Paenarthrobacter nicotinovorans TaxID=29320 RepID=UPI003804BB74
MPQFNRDKASLFYSDTGAPEGRPAAPTIFFGHGLNFGGWMFEPQIQELSRDYRCVAIDWRGQGHSSAADDYGMDTLADDAIALIEELGIGPVHWVGLSMGGFVGMRIAARRPDLIRNLALLATSSERDGEESIAANRALAERIKSGNRPLAWDMAPTTFGKEFTNRHGSEEILKRWDALMAGASGLGDAILGVVDRGDITAEISRISAPTLVMSGDEDTMPPSLGQSIAAIIPGAEFRFVPGAGHASTLDKPDFITEALAKFFSANNESRS